MPNKLTLIEGGGEWSALYVNGHLERVGDHYYVHEKLFELAGVEVLQTYGVDDDYQANDFMLGNHNGGRADVAMDLTDIVAYEADRAERAARAEILRGQAAALLAQAEAVTNGEEPVNLDD